jgi:hypothetical protein
MARPSWEGHLRLSLVTCPVALWPATTEAKTIRPITAFEGRLLMRARARKSPAATS